MTKSEFGRMVGVKPATISAACSRGSRMLAPALVGNRIDASHPAAVAYIKRHADKQGDRLIPERTGKGARIDKVKQAEFTPVDFDQEILKVPSDIRELAEKSLADLVRIFGTDIRFLDWLKAVKEIELVHEKRLKNAAAEGELITRALVKRGIIDPIEEAHVRLLQDGARTIARRGHTMVQSGRSVEDLEKYILDQLTSFIRPLKAKMKRALRNA